MKKVDITIHAGHNAKGKNGCGAVGVLDESQYCRKVLKIVKKKLKNHNISYSDITIDNGKNASDVLVKLKNKENSLLKKINISLHLNCYNGKAKGTEVLYKIKKPNSKGYYTRMKKLGICKRSDEKINDLYIFNHFNAPTFLIEIGFCDNKSDAKILDDKIEKVASALTWFIIDNLKGVKKWQ